VTPSSGAFHHGRTFNVTVTVMTRPWTATSTFPLNVSELVQPGRPSAAISAGYSQTIRVIGGTTYTGVQFAGSYRRA
jgi:hypothetical protein